MTATADNPINNRFDDAQDIPEISCNAGVSEIKAKNNVFARDTNLFAYPCDVQP